MKRLLAILSVATTFLFTTNPAFAEDKLTQCKSGEVKFYVSAEVFDRDQISAFGAVICSLPGDNESEEGVYRIVRTVIAMNGSAGRNAHIAIQTVLPLKR